MIEKILLIAVGIAFVATFVLGFFNKDDNASMIYWDEDDF